MRKTPNALNTREQGKQGGRATGGREDEGKDGGEGRRAKERKEEDRG